MAKNSNANENHVQEIGKKQVQIFNNQKQKTQNLSNEALITHIAPSRSKGKNKIKINDGQLDWVAHPNEFML